MSEEDKIKPECKLYIKNCIAKSFKEYQEDKELRPFSEKELEVIARVVEPMIAKAIVPLQEELSKISAGIKLSKYWMSIALIIVGVMAKFM